MSRFTRPGGVVVLALLAALAILVTTGRTWVQGTAPTTMLGHTLLTMTGGKAVPGLVPTVLAAVAATLAAATAGRVGRRIAVAALGVLTVVGAVLVTRTVLDPEAVLGPLAATDLGRAGSLPTEASVTGWVAGGYAACLLLALACLGAVRGSAGWRGLGARYEAAPGEAAGDRGRRSTTTWEQLSAGEDPTVDAPEQNT